MPPLHLLGRKGRRSLNLTEVTETPKLTGPGLNPSCGVTKLLGLELWGPSCTQIIVRRNLGLRAHLGGDGGEAARRNLEIRSRCGGPPVGCVSHTYPVVAGRSVRLSSTDGEPWKEEKAGVDRGPRLAGSPLALSQLVISARYCHDKSCSHTIWKSWNTMNESLDCSPGGGFVCLRESRKGGEKTGKYKGFRGSAAMMSDTSHRLCVLCISVRAKSAVKDRPTSLDPAEQHFEPSGAPRKPERLQVRSYLRMCKLMNSRDASNDRRRRRHRGGKKKKDNGYKISIGGSDVATKYSALFAVSVSAVAVGRPVGSSEWAGGWMDGNHGDGKMRDAKIWETPAYLDLDTDGGNFVPVLSYRRRKGGS
ncbi:hypothetical protein B0T17DRAFT_505818 [Bombardia bombarda]|uniref:Uncharacterized protein n=1 Tax=Bombardia bombarda TaxID=252184 RepID=A0AA39X8F0_9PEZI|nr:hypothetical protein B0T17DRAFT_505818 [Bombardia bombarda]